MTTSLSTTGQQASIAAEWYTPMEVTALGRWLPFAALCALIALGGDHLRDDAGAVQLGAVGIAVLIAMRWFLPDGVSSARRGLFIGLSVGGLALGLYLLIRGELSVYDLWSRLWLIVPCGLSLYWTLGSSVRSWQREMSSAAAEAGLARNKLLAPRIEAVGSHTLLIHAAALVIIPVIWIADVAVSPGNVLGGRIGDAFTLEHFSRIINTDSFWIWTKNSLIVAVGTTCLGLSLAVPAGYAFSRYEFSGKRESMFAFMLIQMFPGIIILVPYFMVMKTLGLLNTSIGLIIAYSVTALPLCVWMLKGFFDTVPRELEEAAMLDNCNQLQIFLKIVLPLSLPAVAITGLFSFLAAWNEFLLALVFNTANDQFTLPVGLASMIPATGQRWGDFAAASIMVSTPVVILFMLFQKSLVQGLSAGAVKG